MANITEILGTDSVSSSRPVINSNFELLNDELASVVALINPTTGVLSGLTSATTQQLNVVDGSTLLVSSWGATKRTISVSDPGTYYWRVVTKDNHNASSDSGVSTFVVLE